MMDKIMFKLNQKGEFILVRKDRKQLTYSYTAVYMQASCDAMLRSYNHWMYLNEKSPPCDL